MEKFSTRVARGASALTLTLGLVLSLVAYPVASSASTDYQAPSQATAQTITVPAGGTATITGRAFCLDYGKAFPTGSVTAQDLGADNVREALNYAITKDYTSGNAQQVELAIWNLRDNTWHVSPHDIGSEIVTNATAANMPAQGTGTSLVDAVKGGQLTATATFTPQTADEFYGDGQITLKNSGSSDVTVYMPVGVVFSDGNSADQTLLAYQLSVAAQVTGTVSATGTVEATGTVTATETVSVTGTVSPEASVTSVLTGTASPEATETEVPISTAPVTSPTEVASATTIATTVATQAATEVATEVATAVVTETATTAPIATDTPAPAPTDTPVASTLPQTGNSDGSNGLALAILVMGVLLTLAGSTALVISKRRA